MSKKKFDLSNGVTEIYGEIIRYSNELKEELSIVETEINVQILQDFPQFHYINNLKIRQQKLKGAIKALDTMEDFIIRGLDDND